MGAGASGTIDFPAYMKDFHTEWLGTTGPSGFDGIGGLMATATSVDTPYTGEAAYDPDGDLLASQDALTNWFTGISGFDANVDWLAALSQVRMNLDATTFPLVSVFSYLATAAISDIGTKADGLRSSIIVTNAVAAYDIRTAEQYQHTVGQWLGGMVDLNAVQTSSFIWGLSRLVNQRQAEINDYQRSFELMVYNESIKIMLEGQMRLANTRGTVRDSMLSSETERILSRSVQKQQLFGDATKTQVDANRLRIVAKAEQFARDIVLDVEDAQWDFQFFQHGANFLAAINGAPMVPKEPSKFASVLSGGLGGASAGGSMAGPPGAIAGGILGAASSLFG